MGSLRMIVIVGSVREGRFGPTPARWFVRLARAHLDWEVEVVDLADVDLPLRMVEESPLPPHVAELGPRLAAADAFVVVTPEYNRSFPASVKNAVDWFHDEWAAKPVGFVSYGGISGGAHAVQQLRPVFGELCAVTMRDAVHFADFWELFDAAGAWPADDERSKGSAQAAHGMLDQLTWWAHALRDRRSRTPHPA